MSKIIYRGFRFQRSLRLLDKTINSFRRAYSDDKTKNENIQEVRKGVLHNKQQSIQEESFFHKEELQQLKELKKKIKSEKEKKGGKTQKD